MADWLAAGFPHIKHKLDILWGTTECRAYIDSLLVSDKLGRAGFPAWAFDDLLSTLDRHDADYPDLIPKKDLWSVRK